MTDQSLEAFIDDRDRMISIACGIVKDKAIAEELVQDCWIRWSQASYPASQARPILMRILKNLAFDWHRRRRVEFETIETQRIIQDDAPDAERVVIARQQLARVVTALQQLPDRTLLAFRLSRVECLTLKETGKRLGVSESRASQLVSDALLHVITALEGK